MEIPLESHKPFRVTQAQVREALAALGLAPADRILRVCMDNGEVEVEKLVAGENGFPVFGDDYPVTQTQRVKVKNSQTDQVKIAQAFWKAIYDLIHASGGIGDLVYDGDFITGANQAMQERQAEEFGDVRDMIEQQIKIKAGIE